MEFAITYQSRAAFEVESSASRGFSEQNASANTATSEISWQRTP